MTAPTTYCVFSVTSIPHFPTTVEWYWVIIKMHSFLASLAVWFTFESWGEKHETNRKTYPATKTDWTSATQLMYDAEFSRSLGSRLSWLKFFQRKGPLKIFLIVVTLLGKAVTFPGTNTYHNSYRHALKICYIKAQQKKKFQIIVFACHKKIWLFLKKYQKMQSLSPGI